MKVVIVCESMFGNTEILAEIVGRGLTQSGADVRVLAVGDVGPADLRSCDLMVVALPLREWLTTLDDAFPDGAPKPPVAVFDTRVLKTRHWPGSAAARAGRKLRAAGFPVIDRISFYVDGVTGPLSSGEVSRALVWGLRLPEQVRRRQPST